MYVADGSILDENGRNGDHFDQAAIARGDLT
jgi:hypothetical protein